jgi:hypothetical protein
MNEEHTPTRVGDAAQASTKHWCALSSAGGRLPVAYRRSGKPQDGLGMTLTSRRNPHAVQSHSRSLLCVTTQPTREGNATRAEGPVRGLSFGIQCTGEPNR